MTIAVDFDGTIVEHRFPAIGEPIPFAFDTLKAFNEEGHRLILWSNREGRKLEEAVEYCRNNGVEFYAVNSEYPNASWSGSGVSRKIVADLYIDDKNIGGLPDWGEIYSIVMNKSGKEFKEKVLSNRRSAGHSKRHHHKVVKKSQFLSSVADRIRDARQNFKLNGN